ncbi:hypothetical protein [Paenibacillus sp. PL2-23]|uniref:hypothetical protein n=1 Tax=Paenibacillus sp. PL2-23 TaxID=2100729 RepID=UPI0030FA1937
MRISKIFALKSLVILLVVSYLLLLKPTVWSNQVSACLTLLFSLLLCFKVRKNIPLFIITLFILYCNYSIVLGEYLIGGNLGTPMNQTKTTEIYGLSINIMLLFTSILSVFIVGRKRELINFEIKKYNNILLFYFIIFVLILVLLFGVNRGNYTSYEVSITPIYEYSTLLLLLSYSVSGGLKLRKTIITVLCVLFIIQDFYYGGRITSLQIIIFLLITIFLRKLTIKKVIMGAGIGIFINTIVHVYRQNYSFKSIDIINIFDSLLNSYFVFNTPVFAYYSTSTHIATSQIIERNEKTESLLQFVKFIFLGSERNIGDVTYYSDLYFSNIGGGLIPSHFYFWLDWAGVVLATLILLYILSNIGGFRKEFNRIATVCFIYSVPRWYLYTPLSLFRPILLLFVSYIILIVINKIMSKVSETSSLRRKS